MTGTQHGEAWRIDEVTAAQARGALARGAGVADPAPPVAGETAGTSQLIEELTDVLVDCVEGGASVSFMLPLARSHAASFWRGVLAGVAAGKAWALR